MTQFIPSILVETINAVATTIVGVVIPYIAYKLRQLEVIKVTVMGVDGVSSMDGLVGTVELIDEEVECHGTMIQENKSRLKILEDKVENFKSKISSNGKKATNAKEVVEEHEEIIEDVKTKQTEMDRRIYDLAARVRKRNSENKDNQ